MAEDSSVTPGLQSALESIQADPSAYAKLRGILAQTTGKKDWSASPIKGVQEIIVWCKEHPAKAIIIGTAIVLVIGASAFYAHLSPQERVTFLAQDGDDWGITKAGKTIAQLVSEKAGLTPPGAFNAAGSLSGLPMVTTVDDELSRRAKAVRVIVSICGTERTAIEFLEAIRTVTAADIQSIAAQRAALAY